MISVFAGLQLYSVRHKYLPHLNCHLRNVKELRQVGTVAPSS